MLKIEKVPPQPPPEYNLSNVPEEVLLVIRGLLAHTSDPQAVDPSNGTVCNHLRIALDNMGLTLVAAKQRFSFEVNSNIVNVRRK